MILRSFIAAFILFSTLAQASEIIQLTPSKRAAYISLNGPRIWRQKDYACVYVGDQKAACGQIKVTTSRGAVLQFFKSENIPFLEEGLEVAPEHPSTFGEAEIPTSDPDLEFELVPIYKELVLWDPFKKEEPKKKKVAVNLNIKKIREINSTQTTAIAPPRKTDAKFNITAGTNWIYPSISFEMKAYENLSFGLSPGLYWINKLGVASALLGARLTANFYPTHMWKGFWLQGGIGVYKSTTIYGLSAGTQTVPSLFGSLGWRFRWDSFNLGIAAGAQYFRFSSTSSLQFDLNLLNPSVLLNIGWLL